MCVCFSFPFRRSFVPILDRNVPCETRLVVMTHSSLLLPLDYRRHVARDLVAFFHSNRFDLRADAYRSFLENLLLGSLAIGVAVFAVLCVLVVRRTVLHVHLRT